MRKTLFVLIVGGIGGMLLNNLLLPFLIKGNFFNTGNVFNALYRPAVQTIIKSEEKIVTVEPDFWKTVVSKNQDSVGFIQSFKKESLLAQGSIVALTSDGLLATAPQFTPEGADLYQVFINGRILEGKVVFRNLENNIAFVKIEDVNLKVYNFAGESQLGQTIIILAKNIKVKEINNFVQLGIIKETDKKVLILDVPFSRDLNGSAVFNSQGDLVGIAQTNVKNQIFALQPENLKKILNGYLGK